MSNEGVGEEIVEAGLELINPGGRPDVLRGSAKGWRDMAENLTSTLEALDKQVQNVLGEHWRGESADAFAAHWHELMKGVEETKPTFTQAADGLEEAADSIEKVNEEIHAIYLEIGVSIAVGVGLSFVTMGFGGAAAAANAARLAAQAARISARLGQILLRIASAFRRIAQLAKTHKFLMNVAVNWAGNTTGSVAGAAWTGEGVSGKELWEATWQGGLGAVAGTGPGLFAAGRFTGNLASNVAGGVTGNVVGGLAVDGFSAATGDAPSAKEVGMNALVNAVGGGLGGVGMTGVGHAKADIDGFQTPPEGFTPAPQRTGPHMGIDAPVGGLGAGIAGAGTEWVERGMDDSGEKESSKRDSPKEETQVEAKPSLQQRSVRDVFG